MEDIKNPCHLERSEGIRLPIPSAQSKDPASPNTTTTQQGVLCDLVGWVLVACATTKKGAPFFAFFAKKPALSGAEGWESPLPTFAIFVHVRQEQRALSS